MNDQDKQLSETRETEEGLEFVSKPIDIPYQAGQQAKAKNGDSVSGDDFKLVQQDKSIHDIKFTTKPTTFFRDAMHRFRKNRSSVVGAIILGMLFLLAIIIPINGVVPYDLKLTPSGASLNYELNLPPKINEAGSGFWDGTKWYSNQPYPYDDNTLDENGNPTYIGTYPTDDAIVKINNRHQDYSDSGSSVGDGSGGYFALSSDVTDKSQIVFAYSYKYTYTLDASYSYQVSYSLGWKDADGYAKPKYSLLFAYNGNYYNVFDYTDDYGTAGTDKAENATVTPYETKTADISAFLTKQFPGVTSFANASLGIAFQSSTSAKTILYLKDYAISLVPASGTTMTSAMKRQNTQLGLRSFTDANACLGQTKQVNSIDNVSYWASNGTEKLADVLVDRCNILYDMYELTYGLRNDIPAISRSVFDKWIDKGYIVWDYAKPVYGPLNITDAGKASGEVYVTAVSKQNTESGEDFITLSCTVLTWKWLGYSSMPKHLMGTDNKGKDLLKYTFSGLRTSLLLGFIVSAINIIIGIIWGSISGYFGGTIDLVMDRIVDILYGIPWIVLMTVLTIKLGQTFFVFALALCLTGWIGVESITRSQFYRYRDREYVLAARTLGAKSGRLIFHHILPNAIGTIVTSSVLMIPSVIFSEATISYLGLGLKNLDSLGVILSDNQKFLQTYPYQLIFPAIIISLLMICFNLFGNGLRDAFNPSLKGTDE
jgi:ABC-type dipeptide/oligopeptide/nickel transport system permease subunit